MCIIMEGILLSLTLYWDLLTALIIFQKEMGSEKALVMRDTHFEHEQIIIKRYKIIYLLLFFEKLIYAASNLGYI